MATIIDVAKKAGVSSATVSRVLNGNYPVAEETRRLVESAIVELDYTPNVAGQMLRSRNSRNVFIIMTPMWSADRIVVSIQMEAKKHNLNPIVLQKTARHTEFNELEMIYSSLPYGIILLDDSGLTQREITQLVAYAPTVLFGAPSVAGVGDKLAGSVSVDNRQLFYDMAAHMFQSGAASIGYPLLVTKGGKLASFSEERELGIRDAADEYGISRDRMMPMRFTIPKSRLVDGGFILGKKIAEDYARMAHKPDAIICNRDKIAVGCIRQLFDDGFKVPDDVLVSGFDGLDIAVQYIPSITTFKQPYDELGHKLVKMLIGAREDSGYQRQQVIRCKLIPRESTAHKK